MFSAFLKRICPLLIACLILPIISACPQSGDKDIPPQETPEPVQQLPIHKTPGLHLVYTVNDPRTATIGSEKKAHVLIAETDGSRREVLFSFPGFIYHTVPSPAGTHIAFVGNVAGNEDQDEMHLFLYHFKTGRYRDVSASGFYSRAVKTAPVFTQDGKWVLFLSRWAVGSGEYNLFKCSVADGRIAGLYTDPVEEVPLGMMPNGERCVAVRRIPNIPGRLEYIVVDVETGDVEVLHVFENMTKVGPAHIDETEEVIYCDIKPFEEGVGPLGGTRSREVISINRESGVETSLLEPGSVSYIYHVYNDGDGNQRLLLRRQEDIEGEDTPMTRIASCGVDGTDFRYLTDLSARSYLYHPPTNIRHISPDHSLLFFYRQDPVFRYEDIWVMKPDGSDQVNISNTAGYNEGAAGWIEIPESD